MQHSETFAQVATALAAAQGKFPTIPRDRTVTVQPKPKRRGDGSEYWPNPYSFSYAPLETILEKVRPALTENGLALLQSIVTDEKNAEYVRTMLVHASGEWFANETPLFTSGGDNASQAYSSGMTYARRYGVSALLCIAADDDDDGNGNEEGERQQAQRPQGARNGGNGNGRKPVQQPKERPADKPTEPASDGGGAPLSDGQTRLLTAKGKAAGLTLEEVAARFGPVTTANVNDVLRQLGELAEAAAQ